MVEELNIKKVESEFPFPKADSGRLVNTAEFLLKNVYSKLNHAHSGPEWVDSTISTLKDFAAFSKENLQPISEMYYKGEINPPIIWNPKTKANEYPEPTKAAYKKYADAGFIGLALSEEFGGKQVSKAALASIQAVGYNDNTSFQLKETVVIGVLELLENAHKLATGDKKTLIENVIEQQRTGSATGAMMLTEKPTGANLNKMLASLTKTEDGSYLLNGDKKFITGFTTGGIDSVKNAFGIVISNTDIDGKPSNKATASLISYYEIDKHGNLKLDENNQPTHTKGIKTDPYIDKPGIQGQILQQHEFKNVQAVVLGEEFKGFNTMIDVMNSARLGIAAQSIGLMNAALTLDHAHTTKKHMNVGDNIPIALRPQITNKLNHVQAFVDVGHAVLMKMGTDLENSKVDISELQKNKNTLAEQIKARVKEGKTNSREHIADLDALQQLEAKVKPVEDARKLTAIEPSLAKFYFTYKAKELANQAEQMLGSEGYTSPQFQQIKNDIAPTPIYEGPNEMMAKQIAIQNFDKVQTFIDETKRFLKNETFHKDFDKDNALIGEVKECFESFETAHAKLAEKHAKMQQAIAKKDDATQQELATEIYAASEKFADHMGAVMMGRESLRIMKTCLVMKEKSTSEEEYKQLEDRYTIAKAGINNFVVGQYPVGEREVQKQYFDSKKPQLTNELHNNIQEIIDIFKDKNQIEIGSVTELQAKAVQLKSRS